MKYLKIPKERIGALIGKEGEIKQEIEKRTGVKLTIDSREGEVTIADENAKDPVIGLKLADIVKAIGRGFSPEKAFQLFSDDYYFALFDIRDYVGKSPTHVRRIKARVIGKDGKTRRIIEELAGVDLSIYGDTVGIIGPAENLEVAKVAVDMLLNGAEHSSVYRFLEKKRREMKLAGLGFDL